jgi:prepilin-type N-terminal cleavage/methylation domain-containing protein
VTIRPPKYNSQGFTLIEMIVTVMFAGILMAIATPSLLSLNKPLRDGSLQFKSQLSLIRSKAISSGKSYRIRPRYPTAAEYKGEHYQGTPHNFVVEYAANCQAPENNVSPAATRWQAASQLDLDLPEAIGILTSTLPTVADPNLNWNVCFDNRGIAYQAVSFTLKDSQANNRATSALISVSAIGQVDVTTSDKNGATIPLSSDNPVF